jgi:hypothetical protein
MAEDKIGAAQHSVDPCWTEVQRLVRLIGQSKSNPAELQEHLKR